MLGTASILGVKRKRERARERERERERERASKPFLEITVFVEVGLTSRLLVLCLPVQ